MGSQVDPLPLSRVGSRECLPSPNFPQLHFGEPSNGFHPVTWERVRSSLSKTLYLPPPCGKAFFTLGWAWGRGSPNQSRKTQLKLSDNQSLGTLTHSQVPGWTHLRVHQNVVAESWNSEGALDFQHYKGVEGRARSPGIRPGRRTSRSSLILHPKQTTKWLIHIREHPWVLGQGMGTLDHKTHHGPNSGEATTILPIVYSVPLHRTCTRMTLFPGTPKLESRNCPETVPVGILGLRELITPDFKVWLQRGVNQTCSPRRDLSNDVLHSQFGGWEEVDSWLLVVGSQIASLTPGPSFAHNLSYRCPNG
jgi:hypothetical protein